MKDRVKKALKRAASGLMAVLLAVCLVGTPRAKAVVSEGALLGSIFGSLLVSMGFSWAADNFDAPTFGEAIYDLIKQCDEEMNTGIQLLLDSHLAGLTAVGNGKLTFSQQWVKLANSFAEWFQGKFLATSDSAVVSSNSASLTLKSGKMNLGSYVYTNGKNVTTFNVQKGNFELGSLIPLDSPFYITDDIYLVLNYGLGVGSASDSVNGYELIQYGPGSLAKSIFTGANVARDKLQFSFCDVDGYLGIMFYDGLIWCVISGNRTNTVKLDTLEYAPANSLTAEKPAEVHYPEVAEDGSQVYEITVDGVTATDIEGIIQGAVDRILAGTAAIAGSVAQAGAVEGVENPEIDPYKVGLSSVFPFCIPFDVYNMVTMFVAEPEAPHAEWTFTLPWSGQEYSVGWDLSDFDGVAQVCRNMELVLFAVGLAVITYKVIKW